MHRTDADLEHLSAIDGKSANLMLTPEVDPDNRLLWRMNWQRLEAEAIRDSILAVSGRLARNGWRAGGFLRRPADVAGGFRILQVVSLREKEQIRRTIYTFQRRSVMMPMMEVFDGANMQ